MSSNKHTHSQKSKRRAQHGILLLTFCTLLSVHGMQLSGWLVKDKIHDQTTRSLTSLPSIVSAKTTRLLRRLSRLTAEKKPTLHPSANQTDEFPPLTDAVFPVTEVPDWGAMTTPTEWNRRFEKMPQSAFVPLPTYDLTALTQPLNMLLKDRWGNKDCITAKLTYSTRYFGAYDIDASEFTGNHPGIDIKLAEGTPIRSVAAGKVVNVSDRKGLGRTIIVEHRHPSEGAFFSVYGHLEKTIVREEQEVTTGEILGTVGMTGRTTAPHLHLQIDRGEAGGTHTPYLPFSIPLPEIAARHSIHPLTFIKQFGIPPIQDTVAIER